MGSKAPPVPRDQRPSMGRRAPSAGDRHADVGHDPAASHLRDQDRDHSMRQSLAHQGRVGDR
jgi:hypothetical protein